MKVWGVLLYEENRLMKKYYTPPIARLKCILPTACGAGRAPENTRTGDSAEDEPDCCNREACWQNVTDWSG